MSEDTITLEKAFMDPEEFEKRAQIVWGMKQGCEGILRDLDFLLALLDRDMHLRHQIEELKIANRKLEFQLRASTIKVT